MLNCTFCQSDKNENVKKWVYNTGLIIFQIKINSKKLHFPFLAAQYSLLLETINSIAITDKFTTHDAYSGF